MTLIVNQLGKRYGDTAVFSHVNLRVERGQRHEKGDEERPEGARDHGELLG